MNAEYITSRKNPLMTQIRRLTAEPGGEPLRRPHSLPGGRVLQAADLHQLVPALACIDENPGGGNPAQVSAHRPQDGNGLLLHLVKHLQLFQSPFVVPCPQRVGHLKHHRVQDRLRHRVNVRPSDLRAWGKGGNFSDLSSQGGHGASCDVNEIGAQLRGNGLLEIPGR